MASSADFTLSRTELIRQNQQLRKDNTELQVRLTQADAIFRENDRLRQLLGWQNQTPWKVRLASVISRDPANWWHGLQIDLGSRDGIRTNMTVVSAEGLVGRISAVSFTTSQVALIGNQDCKVSAVLEKSGETGVITGRASAMDSSLVTLSYLARNISLKAGTIVRSSGEGKLFPKGLLIGQVVEEAHQVELGYSEARVKLAANTGAIEEVWVLLQ